LVVTTVGAFEAAAVLLASLVRGKKVRAERPIHPDNVLG
jgi:hypothetical protein